jgi:hypothetical protein
VSARKVVKSTTPNLSKRRAAFNLWFLALLKSKFAAQPHQKRKPQLKAKDVVEVYETPLLQQRKSKPKKQQPKRNNKMLQKGFNLFFQ